MIHSLSHFMAHLGITQTAYFIILINKNMIIHPQMMFICRQYHYPPPPCPRVINSVYSTSTVHTQLLLDEKVLEGQQHPESGNYITYEEDYWLA